MNRPFVIDKSSRILSLQLPGIRIARSTHFWGAGVILACLLISVVVMGDRRLGAEEPRLKLIESKKIWDKAPHNAFTDLIRFQDRWFCVFREGKGHVSPDGALRIITSKDGKSWSSAALITSEDSDLRDAKICVTPDDRLMLAGAGAMHDSSEFKHQSYVWYSKDGFNWSEPVPVGDRDFWLWRIQWHKGAAYGFGYTTNSPDRSVRFYRSTDGKNFEAWIPTAFDKGYPNESSILFDDDDTAWCLLRRDGRPASGQLGMSKPPYREWTWKDLGVRIGGPHAIWLPEKKFGQNKAIAAVRLYDGGARTSLCLLDVGKPKLTESLKLPSGGDTSYPGLVWHDGELWVSYYSSHEGKTSIYLARVKVESAKASN